MSAEILRRAAALMRERAEAATPGQWVYAYQTVCVDTGVCGGGGCGLGYGHEPGCSLEPIAQTSVTDGEHIASWHPAVALAVADWLDKVARSVVGTSVGDVPFEAEVLAVARAYLKLFEDE